MLLGLCFIVLYINLIVVYVSTNEVELRRSLFHKRIYDQKVRPQAGVITVHTNLILLQIESVNEKAQVCFVTLL